MPVSRGDAAHLLRRTGFGVTPTRLNEIMELADRNAAVARVTGPTARQERRSQLLEAAVEAIRAIGPGATMEQLARAGGVTKPILYRHFGDRLGLISSIADQVAADLMGAVAGPMATDVTLRELLHATIDAYIGFIEQEPNLYRFLVQQPPERGDGLSQISSLVDTIAKEVALVAGGRLRQAGRDSSAAVPWAYGIVGFAHQAGDWWVDHRTMSREVLVDHLTALLADGLDRAAIATTPVGAAGA